MKSSIQFALVFLLIFSQSLHSQTVGVTEYQPEALEGYSFFSPFSGTKAYLVDNCGNLINEWDRGTRPGLSAYFLENGLMMRTFKPTLNGPFTSASNAGGIELVDWNNNTVWTYQINTSDHLSHHDAVMMPNGNILTLSWKLVYTDEIVEMGRNPSEIATEGYMWSERIMELEPIGTNDANVVWEWNIYDHYIQDFDDTKSNFGVVSEHPELFDINVPELDSDNSNSTRDWNHFNAIDYNEELDQILISARNSDEIWIIDHSTTTEEAATHEGGTYGQGGDILFRWGNPNTYDQAEISDQKLFGQHGVNWIKEGLEDAGKILIYNNGNQRPGPDFSQIDIIDPAQSSPGFYEKELSTPWGPSSASTIYGDLSSETFYSPYFSNAQRLPNGNTLVNAGSPGNVFEITTDRQVVWQYIIPLFGDFPADQGDNVNNNGTFRTYKYPVDYPGFEGLDLTPGEPIEGNPLSCEILVKTIEQPILEFTHKYLFDQNILEFYGLSDEIHEAVMYNIQGQSIASYKISAQSNRLNFDDRIKSGMYIINISDQSNKSKAIKIQIQ